MNKIMVYVIGSIALGYFLGCINCSYILSKIKGFDIRKYGSGNAGASNVMIVIGRKAGIFVALFDIFKASMAVLLAELIFPDAVAGEINYASVIAGASSIVGHIIPFYMKFRGGKGLATIGGTILALDPKLTIIFLVIAIAIAVITDYICFVPIIMVVAIPAGYGLLHNSWIPLMAFAIPIILVWYRHVENIRRIRAGKELRFHFLWNRKAESERMGIADDGKAVFENEVDKENNNINLGLK